MKGSGFYPSLGLENQVDQAALDHNGLDQQVCLQPWPEYDESKTVAATTQMAVQVGGKLKANEGSRPLSRLLYRIAPQYARKNFVALHAKNCVCLMSKSFSVWGRCCLGR